MHEAAHDLEVVDGRTKVPIDRLISAIGAQSARTIAALQLLHAAEWERPTRCDAWSLRQLIQHVVTASERAALLLDPDLGPTRSAFTAMDPRFTPLQWLETDGDASPASLLARYRAVRAQMLDRASDLVRRGARFSVDGPTGRMSWEVFLLHGLWDSWMHERDAGFDDNNADLEHRERKRELQLVGTYSLYIAVEAARLGGCQLSARVVLDGPGGGTWIIAGTDTTSVRQVAAPTAIAPAGTAPATDTAPATGTATDTDTHTGDRLPLITGPAVEVFEALCGRGMPLRTIASGDAEVVAGLSALATFFTSSRLCRTVDPGQ